jgi:hypothetical protein
MTDREILVRLLELTPEPPVGAEVDQLLAGFDAILAGRAEVLATIVPPLTLAEADRPLLAELERLHGAWNDALAAAQRMIATQRCGAVQLRAYAPTL